MCVCMCIILNKYLYSFVVERIYDGKLTLDECDMEEVSVVHFFFAVEYKWLFMVVIAEVLDVLYFILYSLTLSHRFAFGII